MALGQRDAVVVVVVVDHLYVSPFKTFPTIAPLTSQHNSGRCRCTNELVLKLICSHSVRPWFADSLLFRPTVRERTGFTITDSVAVRTKIETNEGP